MRRLVLSILALLCLTVWGAAAFLLRSRAAAEDVVIPTLMVLPSLTPTPTHTLTQVPSLTWTASPTATLTLTPTPSPTPFPTLSERLLRITAIMPGVMLPLRSEEPMEVVQILDAPPLPIEPLPDATQVAPPFVGWYRFESDYPAVRYDPPWTPQLSSAASRGQYHRAETAYSRATFPFEGEAVRLRYVGGQNMGEFDAFIDGVLFDTIDAYASEQRFLFTDIYRVASGSHMLEVRGRGSRNPLSAGYVTALDAIHVFRSDAHTQILPPGAPTPSSTPSPRPARVELISAPPTLQPTPSPVPPRVLTASVVIAYDENNNRTVDPAEGVAGISVRVVETQTNRIIASGFTDARGYAAFEIVSDAPVQLVVPYFGESWPLQRSGAASAFTLLLTPGNQPGLIP